jgi:hypothetical protein
MIQYWISLLLRRCNDEYSPEKTWLPVMRDALEFMHDRLRHYSASRQPAITHHIHESRKKSIVEWNPLDTISEHLIEGIDIYSNPKAFTSDKLLGLEGDS